MAASQSPGAFGSDENVWFGQNDVEAESRAAASVAAVGAKIIGAKPFPIAARRLEELTRNPKARLEQVVSVLETDPGLSLRLLRLVNSAGYGLKVRVTSVRHAAVLVGTRRLHHVATTAAILDLFDSKNNQTAFELLEHASVVGSLCRYLGVHLGLPHDELFTCGFLHDIGKLMLLDTEGARYSELVRNFGGGPDQLHIKERELFGFDHALLGAHVLSAWNIPEPVPKVIACHHQPSRAMQDPGLAALVQTLRLADQLSYALALETDAVGIALAMSGEAPAYLDISEAQLAALWPDLRALWQRSRDRSKGDDLEIVAPRRIEVPRSLRPRRSSLPPRSQRTSLRVSPMPSVEGESLIPRSERGGEHSLPASKAEGVHEVPAHFPCVACSKPSYGNRCAACDGHVCPEHQTAGEQWCILCVREFERFRAKKQIPAYFKVGGLAAAGFSVGASLTGALASRELSLWKLVVAPLSMLLLWAVLLPVGFKFWQRVRFLRTRPKGRAPLPIKLPKPDAVFISELDASLDSEGALGPSLAPPVSSASVASSPEITLDMVPHLASVSDELAKTLDRVAEELESSSDLTAAMPEREAEAPNTPAPESESRLIASVTPPADAQPTPVAAAAKDPTDDESLASNGEQVLDAPQPLMNLSRFPSTDSAHELEAVVSAVSARLRREALSEYSGPSAALSEPPEPDAPPAEIPAGPRTLPAGPADAHPAETHPAAALFVEPPALDVEAKASEPPVAAQDAIAPSTPAEPAPATPEVAEVRAAESVPAPHPRSSQSAVPPPRSSQSAVPHPRSSQSAAPPARIIVPRANLAHGCRAQVEFYCAVPDSAACTVLPPGARALRPSAYPRTPSEPSGPSTLRGLGD
ncbi:MAG TPA: HDOD domain-containing protein [Polyangiaceae bacterium]